MFLPNDKKKIRRICVHNRNESVLRCVDYKIYYAVESHRGGCLFFFHRLTELVIEVVSFTFSCIAGGVCDAKEEEPRKLVINS